MGTHSATGSGAISGGIGGHERLAAFVVKCVGGGGNIRGVTHCLTRLRFDLVDDALVDDTALAADPSVVTTRFAGGRYQVVIGAQVGEVCDAIERLLPTGPASGARLAPSGEKTGLLDRFTAVITQVMTPALGVLCGCGIIAGLMAVLVAVGLVQAGDGTYQVLNAMGNACLTFFPVILGYTSARAFGMNPFTGMILGAVLMFPGLAESMTAGEPLFTAFDGTPLAAPVYQTFFGIPVLFPSAGYTSTVIPIIFSTFVASKVERWANSALPSAARMFVTPMLVVLIAGVVTLLVVGPVSVVLTNLISWGISWMLANVPVLAYLVVAVVYQPLVIFGLHWALITVGLVEFATTGSTLIVGLIFPASFAHLAVCAAVMLRTRDARLRETSLAAVISACFCIIEPSIYGVTLPVKKRFGICMLAGTVGAVVVGLTNARMYAIAMGVTGLASFIDPVTGAVQGLLACVASVAATMVVGFAVTWATFGEEGPGPDAAAAPDEPAGVPDEPSCAPIPRHERSTVFSPVTGAVRPLSAMGDPAFSGGAMGAGVCVEPSEGVIVSPCDGILTTLFPTGHAFGVTGDDGAEVLVHIGANTVQLGEGVFSRHVPQGARVRAGDRIVSFDANAVRAAGYDLKTAVIVSNSAAYLEVVPVSSGEVSAGDPLLVAVALEARPAAPSASASASAKV